MEKLFSYIKDILGLTKPASKIIYEEANNQLMKWTKRMGVAIMKFTPTTVVLPKAIISCFDYFFTGLGNDAFQIPLLIWYVSIILLSISKLHKICICNVIFFKGLHTIGEIQSVIWLRLLRNL